MIQDVSPQRSIAARIGGDEFAILLPYSCRAELERICRDIQVRVGEFNATGKESYLSLSMGFSAAYEHDFDPTDLFKESDNALSREKLLRSQSTRSSLVHTVMTMLEARDFITEGHADRLQVYVDRLAAVLGFSGDGARTSRFSRNSTTSARSASRTTSSSTRVAHERRNGHHAPALGNRAPDRALGAGPSPDRRLDPEAPRILGRKRIPDRPQQTGHSSRMQDARACRRVRRHDERPPLPESPSQGDGDAGNPAVFGKQFDPELVVHFLRMCEEESPA
jgi:hypothetical protein